MIDWIVAAALAASPASAAPERKNAKAARAAENPMEWRGQYGGPGEGGHEVAGDAESWARLWALAGKEAPQPPDFKRFVAVAVFAGEKPTGGFRVDFLEPEKKDGRLVVRYAIKRPAGIVTQALTQPWAIKLFERPRGEVVVEAAPR